MTKHKGETMFHGKIKSLLAAGIFSLALGTVSAAPLRILCIDQSGAFAHTSAINWLSNYLRTVLGPQQGWTVVAPTSAAASAAKFTTDTLATYNVIIWNNNTSAGNVITNATQRLAYQTWVRKGGGTLGWHGFLDHADLWPFITDSILAGTKFTDHSPWNSAGGRNAKVRWDTVKVNNETTVRANAAEYAAIKAGITYALTKQNSTNDQFTYPDEWYSFRTNPRLASASTVWGGFPRAPDILYTIEENTYDVPTAVKMGPDHPEAWAYKFPKLCPADSCHAGRFIFSARGHDVGAYDGKSTNAAPNGSDSAQAGPTKTFILEAIKWAAAGQAGSTSINMNAAARNSILNAHKLNGELMVAVSSLGNEAVKYSVEVFTLSGQKVAQQSGHGEGQYSFSHLKASNLYLVQVKSGKKTYTQRVML